jgi:hypothetical protein
MIARSVMRWNTGPVANSTPAGSRAISSRAIDSINGS